MPKVVVQKFGGTSLSSIDRIKKVAQIIKNEHDSGSYLIVIVSAMSSQTDRLIDYSKQLGGFEGSPEYDVVVSTGELVTSGLIAQALAELSIKAKSFLPWQIPIITDNNFGRANITSINAFCLNEYMNSGGIPIIPGFQGICDGGNITTLGRGGSDLTAVAIAAEIKAVRCDIFTDVDGVFTADPMIVGAAKKIDSLDYEDMLEFASNGAKVLQTRSVESAMKNRVLLRVTSSFGQSQGTMIGKFIQKDIVGIGFNDHLVKLKIALTNQKHIENLLDYFNKNLIKHDIYSRKDNKYVFIMNENDAQTVIGTIKHSNIAESVEFIPQSGTSLSKITVIGSKAITYINKIRTTLEENGIEVLNLLTSNTLISFLTPYNSSKKALNIVHKAVNLN